ncbi:hypothetical protein T484DRAFT_3644626, partial [Baffinella frigidus]
NCPQGKLTFDERSVVHCVDPQPSTLNPPPSTLNPQPSTLHPQPSTLNPQPGPRVTHAKPHARNRGRRREDAAGRILVTNHPKGVGPRRTTPPSTPHTLSNLYLTRGWVRLVTNRPKLSQKTSSKTHFLKSTPYKFVNLFGE